MGMVQRACKPYHLAMPVFLDDQAVDWPARTLAEALDAAARHVGDAGRVVTDVYLDGRSLVGSELDDSRDTDVRASLPHP